MLEGQTPRHVGSGQVRARPFEPGPRDCPSITALELMSVATFPVARGWGYDGLYTSAPHPAYGGPDGLARLLRPRRELPRELEVRFDEGARTLELRRGAATLRVDFGNETVELEA